MKTLVFLACALTVMVTARQLLAMRRDLLLSRDVTAPRTRDTAPPSTFAVGWRVALIIACAGFGLFVFTPAGERFGRTAWPFLLFSWGMGAFAASMTVTGLRRGRIELLSRGRTLIFSRASQPWKFWLSAAWNSAIALALFFIGAAITLDRQATARDVRCIPENGRTEGAATVAACTDLLADAGVSGEQRSRWLVGRGWAESDAGDRAAAQRDIAAALELDPDNAGALVLRGFLARNARDLDQANADFDRALAAEPDDPEAHFYRAMTRGERGDIVGAVADLDEAIRLAPDYAAPYQVRGQIRRAQGESLLANTDLATYARLTKGETGQ